MSNYTFTRMRGLIPLLSFVEQNGGHAAKEKLLRGQDLPVGLATQSEAQILWRDSAGLYARAARMLGDGSIGLRMGARYSFPDLGLYGTYVLQSSNLSVALTRTCDALGFYQSGARAWLEIDGNAGRLHYNNVVGRYIGGEQVIVVVVLLMIDLIRCFAGSEWRPRKIGLRMNDPSLCDALLQRFHCPVFSGQSSNYVEFEGELLCRERCRPLRQANAQPLVRADLQALLSPQPPRSLPAATKAVLRLRLLDGQTDLDGTARKLEMGPRTLQRRLRQEGLSYNDILRDVRSRRAVALLTETVAPTSDIATMLGYAGSSHFSRAFKHWTGMSPSDYRQARGHHIA